MRPKKRTNAATHRSKAPTRRDREGKPPATFETLVGQLSTAMARTRAQDVDGEIENWLGKIAVALNIDRCAIFQRESVDRPLLMTHIWRRPDPKIPKGPPVGFDAGKHFPDTAAWVMAGKTLVYSHKSQIPSAFRVSNLKVLTYLPDAQANIPMWAGDRVIGGATFGKFHTPMEWPEPLLDQLVFAVSIFGSAIERKQAALQAQAARAELLVAQRRSMMGELVASLAHELNQPLGAIMSNLGALARLISQGDVDQAIARKAINNAIEDTQRAGEIVRRVRAFFKSSEIRQEKLEIGALVSEVVGLIGSESALREIEVQIDDQPLVPSISGDRILLQQCILNLMTNAFESIVQAKSETRVVSVKIYSDGQKWVVLRVSDTGGGIHESISSRLFEPFVSTKPDGMGLGLLVTRSIVEEHGGKISFEANPQAGATFTVILPSVKNDSKPLGHRRPLMTTNVGSQQSKSLVSAERQPRERGL